MSRPSSRKGHRCSSSPLLAVSRLLFSLPAHSLARLSWSLWTVPSPTTPTTVRLRTRSLAYLCSLSTLISPLGRARQVAQYVGGLGVEGHLRSSLQQARNIALPFNTNFARVLLGALVRRSRHPGGYQEGMRQAYDSLARGLQVRLV
jgi:hypothetical protein